MCPWLRTLIVDYQAFVARACELLQLRLKQELSSDGWLDHEKTMSCTRDGMSWYIRFGSLLFKVYPCFDFQSGSFVCEFHRRQGNEFCGRNDGFDSEVLSKYAAIIPGFSEFTAEESLRAELLALFNAGELVRIPQFPDSNLYYFPDHTTSIDAD
jgi:hypothetical protein